MPLLHLLGFARLECGCLIVRYHEQINDVAIDYVEEPGCRCVRSDHKRNHPVPLAASAAAKHPTARGVVRAVT